MLRKSISLELLRVARTTAHGAGSAPLLGGIESGRRVPAERRIGRRMCGTIGTPSCRQRGPQMSSYFEDLKELQAMLERGEVTRGQYDVVKAGLLADMSQDSSSMEPGWYNDPSGQASQQAYWDGSNWTGATRPDPGIGHSPSASPVAAAKSPIYKRGWFIALVVVLGVAFVGASLIEGTDTQTAKTESRASSDTTQSNASSGDTEAPTPTTQAPASQFTRSEENAIGSAESYLSFAAFSRSGLINQLEFDGFTPDQATRGVNSITVNWNEQAWKSAESYLGFSNFSRSGLIDQLLFEGFTQSQATYGVDKAGL